jgi:hypothetical protein
LTNTEQGYKRDREGMEREGKEKLTLLFYKLDIELMQATGVKTTVRADI